jgi:hypothetical protein
MSLTTAALAILCFLAQDKRLAVPDEASLKEADKLIRDLFKDDLAKKTAADRRLLAKKLVSQAKESQDLPASQYALLTMAVDLSVQAVEVETALSAAGELGARFQVDAAALRASALAGLSKAAKAPEELKYLGGAFLTLADEAMKDDRFDEAAKAVSEAAALGRRAKEFPMISSADAKGKEIAARKLRFEKIRKSKETLAAMPDDPAANLVLGQYYCFVKEDWVPGITCLAKGPEGPLRDLARKDQSLPPSPEERIALADGWWAQSDIAAPAEKVAIRDHAAWWYLQAVASTSGLTKTRIEKRMLEARTERLARGTWVDFTDANQFGLKGKAGEPLEVINTNDNATLTVLTSKAFPPGEYDGFTLRARLKMDVPYLFVFYKGPGFEGEAFVVVGGKAKTLSIPGAQGLKTPLQIVPFTVADEYVLTVLHAAGKDTVYWNGAEIGSWSNPNNTIDSLRISCYTGTTLLDKIRLRKRQ